MIPFIVIEILGFIVNQTYYYTNFNSTKVKQKHHLIQQKCNKWLMDEIIKAHWHNIKIGTLLVQLVLLLLLLLSRRRSNQNFQIVFRPFHLVQQLVEIFWTQIQMNGFVFSSFAIFSQNFEMHKSPTCRFVVARCCCH